VGKDIQCGAAQKEFWRGRRRVCSPCDTLFSTMPTILYVEDHPPAQLLMRAIIAEFTTHRLITAGTGTEALRLAHTERPALYIVDLDLPDTDGITLITALKTAHPAPAVLVSAYAEAVDGATLGTRIDSYLAKPLDPTYVAQIIERTLAG